MLPFPTQADKFESLFGHEQRKSNRTNKGPNSMNNQETVKIRSTNASAICCLALLCNVLASCEQTKEAPTPSPRPVSVMIVPPPSTEGARTLAGIVKPWADEDVSAEVTGRIEFVEEQGRQLEGRWVESDEVIVEGDVLARIDSSAYEAAVRAAEAEVERARVHLEEVIPALIAEAKAAYEREEEELRRIERLDEQTSATRIEIIRAQAAIKIASAKLSSVQAEEESARANLAVAKARLETAQLDLNRTTLYAPFTGELAAVHKEAGGYVNIGTPVGRLVMMDPILVEATVSAETAREIETNDNALVISDSWEEPLRAKVYYKSTTADPRTLTHTLSIITRNPVQGFDGGDGVKPIGNVFPLQYSTIGKPSEFIVLYEQSLFEDEQGHYVWKLEPADGENQPAIRNPNEVFIARRVAVVPGDKRRTFQGIAITRTLKDIGTLNYFDYLAQDPPPDLQDGDLVRVRSLQWSLKPGAIVEVVFPGRTRSATSRVPVTAIRYSSESTGHVFVVRNETATRVPVQLGVIDGVSQEVTVDGDFDLVGEALVIRGAQYLSDGESVRVVATLNTTSGEDH